MATIVQETRIALSAHESLLLGPLPGHTVRCLAGELWLTVERESQDLILGPGRSWKVTSPEAVVVSAFKDAEFLVRPCPRRGFGFGGVRRALASLLALRPRFSFP